MKVVDFSVSTPQHIVLGTRVARCVALLQQFGAHNQNDSIKGETFRRRNHGDKESCQEGYQEGRTQEEEEISDLNDPSTASLAGGLTVFCALNLHRL